MGRKSKIDKDILMKYIEEGLNQRQCAERFRVNRNTLGRWMKRNNIDYKFSKIKDLKGNRYGRLVVLSEAGLKEGNMTWLCKCDCGNEKVILGTTLTRGSTRSCGCLIKETTSKNNIARSNKNGATTSNNPVIKRLSSIYNGMKNRCYNEKSKDYKDYGYRGVSISDEWLGDLGFENFKNWALKNEYNNNLTIDRIDVNGNYEPNNCRWVTLKEQANNTRKSKYITINNETKTLAEWSDFIGINQSTFKYRYNKNNDLDYITSKRKYNCVYIEIDGVERSVSEWAKISGLNSKTIYNRYKNLNWTGEKLLSPSKKKEKRDE